MEERVVYPPVADGRVYEEGDGVYLVAVDTRYTLGMGCSLVLRNLLLWSGLEGDLEVTFGLVVGDIDLFPVEIIFAIVVVDVGHDERR